MWGCEDVDQQMWRCEDVDQQTWGCEDVGQQMWGCEDVDQQMWRCEDVDQQKWGCEDVLQRLLFYEEPFAGALGNNSNHLPVHQWIRSAILDSQQPTSPIGFLCLKLPPPPCAVLLVFYIYYILHSIVFCCYIIRVYIYHMSHVCLHIYIYTSTCNVHMWNKWVSVSHTFFSPLGSHWSNRHSPLCKSLISRYEAIIWGVSILLERFRKYRSNKSTFTNEGSVSSPTKSFEHVVKEIVYQQTSTDVNPQTAEHQWKICSQGRHRTRDPVSSSPMHTTQSQCESCTSQRVSTVMEWAIRFTSIILSETGSNSKKHFPTCTLADLLV